VTVSRPKLLTAFLAGLTIMSVSAYLTYPNAVPDFRPDQEHDAFFYMRLANDIGNGLGYPTKHWMPGFPYLLSWLIGVFGLDYFKLKLSIVAFGVGAYAATFAYVRCIAVQLAHRHLIAWVVALSTALSPMLFDYSHRLMSEMPALCCAMTALWLCEVVRRTQSTRMLLTAAVALAAFCGLAVLIRGNALALVPALLVSAAYDWRARRRAAIACVVAATFTLGLFVGWSARNANQTYAGIHNVTYLQEIQARDNAALWRAGGFDEGVERVSPAELARRVYQNGVWYHIYGIADGVVPGIRSLATVDTSRLGVVLALTATVPVLIGVFGVARYSPAGVVYLVATFGLALAFPTGGSPRMLIPSVPLLQVAAFFGIASIGSVAGALAWTAAVSAALCAATLTFADRQAKSPYSYPGFSDYYAGFTLVNRLVPARALLVTPHPAVADAWTSLRAVRITERDGAITTAAADCTESDFNAAAIREPQFYLYDDGRLASLVDLSAWHVRPLAHSGSYVLSVVSRQSP
jgi:hypothetical protein